MNNQYQSRTAQEVADIIAGELIGDNALKINGLSSIENDIANTVTFYANSKYSRHIEGKQRRAILVPQEHIVEQSDLITFIKVQNVYESISQLSSLFKDKSKQKVAEISPKSHIESSAQIGRDVSIGHYSIIEADVRIANNVVIHSQVFVGTGVSIGEGTIIHSGVKMMSGVVVGARCIIYPNAVIGADGFGHSLGEIGYSKLHHNGGVIIEDDVEIGSNTCVDSGVIDSTIIRKGAKLDNLIQVAHGVEIGEHVAIAAQSGISGSASVGSGSQIGGQVGIVGHVNVAKNSKIQAKSGIASDIKEEGKKWYGYPNMPYFGYLRSYAIFKKLPDLLLRIRKLEDIYNKK